MPFTPEDAENLRRAIAEGRGARHIQFFDQSITFNSLKEMLDLLAVMEQEATATTRQNYRLAATRKGV